MESPPLGEKGGEDKPRGLKAQVEGGVGALVGVSQGPGGSARVL